MAVERDIYHPSPRRVVEEVCGVPGQDLARQ
jgi:hypothetical protein